MRALGRSLKRFASIAALFGLAAGFTALGAWQLGRAEGNRELVDRFDTAGALPALTAPVEDPDSARYRKLSLRGRFLAEPQVLLDNRVHGGIAGYEVLTAFEVPGHDRLVVVNRGWVPAAERRDLLPDVAIEGSSRRIVGRVDSLPRIGLDLGNGELDPGRAAYVLSYPTFADLEAVLGRGVYRFQLLLDEAQDGVYTADWRPPADRSTRNLAYAGQWFLFAIMACGAGLFFLLAPILRKRR